MDGGSTVALGSLSRRALEYLAKVALSRGVPAPADPELHAELLRHSLVSGGNDIVAALETSLRQRDRVRSEALLDRWQQNPTKFEEVWSLLEADSDTALRPRRFQIALIVNSGRSLRWLIDQPHPADPGLHLMQIEAMIRRGECRGAVDLLEDMTGARALLLLGEALCGAGEPRRAIEVLKGLNPASDHTRARRDLALVSALFHADRSLDAQRLLGEVETAIAVLPTENVGSLEARASGLRIRLGLRQGTVRDARVDGRLGVDGVIAQSLRHVANGSLRRSTQLLESLSRQIDLPAEGNMLVRIMQGVFRIIRGRYAGLPQLASAMTIEAEQMGNATLYYWSYLLERLATLGEAHKHPEPLWAERIPKPTGIPARYLAAIRASHRARAGLVVADHEIPAAEPGDGPFVECICRLTEAHVRLLQNDGEAAVALARDVIGRTVGLGYRFFEGEALLIQCYALLQVGDYEHLRDALGILDRIAQQWRSDRYATLAELLRCSQHRHPDVPALLRVARKHAHSPTAARVSCALLGGPALSDALDKTIARGVSKNWTATVTGLSPDASTWVFDPIACVAHIPHQTRSLSPMDVCILNELFLAGGSLTLEEFANRVWELAEFHPLRDSKRIHVAMRRLRKRIEDDPSQPKRLVTHSSGYRLELPVGRLAEPG